MAVQTQRMTVEEFERFAERPENANRRLEDIGGEVVEVASNSYSSLVAGNILFAIKLHLRDSGLQGYVTGADGGYKVAGEDYLPDVGFIAKVRLPDPPHETWISLPPDLAVEVLSPSDKPDDTRIKLVHYLAAGTVVWVVDPDQKQVEVYTPGPAVKRLGEDDTLDGSDVLPGFTLAVKEIFPE
jgi:Uma2 family endonuclease